MATASGVGSKVELSEKVRQLLSDCNPHGRKLSGRELKQLIELGFAVWIRDKYGAEWISSKNIDDSKLYTVEDVDCYAKEIFIYKRG